ncbi:B12-binding domain-containing protein [Streptomyces sp. NPDC059176]|uniref:cobalamin B12-binding domain-containing protein n=1 Tax=Streptomyces sp. NPDC059176 TaxID=3346758 RepID=UPI0036A047C3
MTTGTDRRGSKQSAEALRSLLWTAVLDGDEHTAVDTAFAGLEGGLGAETVLLDVIAPVQGRVGAEWAANRISVAQEHAATAINDRVIAAVAREATVRGHAQRGRVTVACVTGEWHALPARLVAEVLALRGWTVDFLGAQVPTPHLVAHLHRTDPAALLLSVSIPTHLPTAHAAISACQAIGIPVLAGGAAFGPDGRYARLLGAEGWAPDAKEAAALVGRGVERPRPGGLHLPVEDLPHLADQEFTLISRTKPLLVKQTLSDLEERLPAMRAYSARQREHTVEDVAHIVDHLAAALYVADGELFTDFVRWTADVLASRGVPVASLFPALDSLGEQMNDFPRARAHLNGARKALTPPGQDTLA